jgi:SPOR domain
MRDLANQELGLVAVGALVRGGDGRSADRRQGGAMLNAGPGAGRRSGRWTKIASALVPAVATLLFGTVLFVTVFGPKGGPTGARSTRPPLVKVVSSEERPTDVDASSALIPTLAPSEPAPTSVEPAAQVATLRPAVSQSTESNPLRMASAPPDAPAPSATLASEAAPLDAPQRLAEAAPRVEGKVVVGAQPRTPNLHRIAKLSRRLTVAKTAATAPSARAEMLRQPQHSGASTIPLAPIEPHTVAAPAAAQKPVNPMTHVFGGRTGVLGPSAVDQTATKSGDWAIQFAEPKSEVEAEAAAARLSAKYAPALNGAAIGVRKTQVNGETIYALRVAGLSKADAIALCVRVKGRDCSIIK